MGRTRDGDSPRKDDPALPPPKLASFPSPSSSSSSSSSDFEFNVALSPSSKRPCSQLCPADELFYKGQLLPLHLPPRISMVRALLLASSSTSSSSDTTTTASRDSNGSSSSSSFSADLLADCDSSRPSSVTEEDAPRAAAATKRGGAGSKFSSFATRFSSVFLHRGSKKDQTHADQSMTTPILPAAKKTASSSSSSSSTTATTNTTTTSSSAAKGVIKKCVKKVKPLYDKLSSLQQKPNQHPHPQPQPQPQKKTFSFSIKRDKLAGGKKLRAADRDCVGDGGSGVRRGGLFSHHHRHRHPQSFSGNLGEPRRKEQWAASCPSSIRSSPSHSGLLCLGAGEPAPFLLSSSSASSMEELQNAIQGAIAHCKSTMNQKKASSGQAISCSKEEIARSQ